MYQFIVSVRNDTLVRGGIEKVAAANIDRQTIETYVRQKHP
jgi:hypothetical protein